MNQKIMLFHSLYHRLSVWQRCTELLKQNPAVRFQKIQKKDFSTRRLIRPTITGYSDQTSLAQSVGPCSYSYYNLSSHSEIAIQTISTSVVYFKRKFDMKKIQIYNVYDHNGGFLTKSELYNVEKFCEHFKRFDMKVLDAPLNSDGDTKLPSIQISFSAIEGAPKRIKNLLFKTTENWALDKLNRVLLEDGVVTLEIKGKKVKEIQEFINNQWVARECNISTVKKYEKSVLLQVKMPETISSPIVQFLFMDICKNNEEFIESLHELKQLEESEQ